jgi:hypothetical protein
MTGHAVGEFARLTAAEEALGDPSAEAGELLDAQAGIVDLLEQDALLDDESGSLTGDPTVVLALMPETGAGVSTATARVPVVAATRQGTLVRAALSPGAPQARERRLEILAEQRIEGFNPDRDLVLGLYWTRNSTIFHDRRDLLLVTRQGGAVKVYQTFADSASPASEPLHWIGDRVPPWMEICPVGAPPAHDLLLSSPRTSPPTAASAAVLFDGHLYSSLRVRRDDQPYAEAESLHCCSGQVVLVCADQSLMAHEARRGKLSSRPAWERTLERQPLCICPIPSGLADAAHPSRLLICHEAGAVSSLAVVGRTAVRQVWERIVDRIGKSERLSSLGDWIAWARQHLERHAISHLRTTTLLNVLLLQVQALQRERGAFTEEVAQVFRRLLSVEEFLPVLYTMRGIMCNWTAQHEPLLGDALAKIYKQLPYQLQDLVDVELQHLPSRPRGGPAATRPDDPLDEADLVAYRTLLKHRDVNRAHLLVQHDISERARLAVLAEQWLDSYVLEAARSTRQPEPFRLRFIPRGERCLVLHRSALSQLDTESWGGRDLTPPGWIYASRGAFRVGEVGGALALAAANERTVKLFSFDAHGQPPELIADCPVPEGATIVKAADAGQGQLLLLVTPADGAPTDQLWLVSWRRQGRLLARRELDCRRPLHWGLQPIQDGGEWLLAADVAEDEIGLFDIRVSGADGLDLQARARRRLRGRVRSLSMAADSTASRQGAMLWVGTTAGYVFALRCQTQDPCLVLEWVYRMPGAVRHIANTRHEGGHRILVISATGEARVLGATGDCLWRRRLSTPLRSATFARQGELRFVVLLDSRGFFHAYRETSAAQSWQAAQDSLARIGEGQNSGTALWEMVHAMRLVAGDPAAIPPEVLELKTRSARACAVRRFGELLETMSEAAWASPIAGLLEELGPSELLPLARLRGQHMAYQSRRRLIAGLLRAVASQGDATEVISDPGPAVELLAELARGIGAGILVPEALDQQDLNVWWRIAPELREDLWVMVSLLLGKGERARTDDDLSALVAAAAWFGPAGFEALPLVVHCEHQGPAEALRLAVRAIDAPASAVPDPDLHRLLDNLPLSGYAASFVGLLRFLCRPGSEWGEFLQVISEPAMTGEPNTRVDLPPELMGLIAWTQIWPRAGRRELVYAPLEQQLNAVEQLAGEEPVPPVAALPRSPAALRWDAWIRRCAARFGDARRIQLDTRRKSLRGLLWVRLEQVRIERLTGSLVKLQATLVREGREHASPAMFRLTVERGMRLLDRPAESSWPWMEIPARLTWLGSLDPPDGESVTLVASTAVAADGYRHRLDWHAAVPLLESEREEHLLSRRPAICEGLLKEVVEDRRAGLHVLALDPELGAQAVASRLLQEPGTRWVHLDEVLRDLGPGRAQPAGFNAVAVLHAMGADQTASGWRVRRRDGFRRVLLHPAEETVTRLHLPTLGAVAAELWQALEHVEGVPVFVLLPTELAARLQGNLSGNTWYHTLNMLPDATEAARSRELDAWLTAAAAPLGREDARRAVAILGSHLPLLNAWVSIPPERRPDPRQFLSTEASERLLRRELAALTSLELGDLVLAASAHVRKRIRELEPGMISAQEVLSTVRRGRAKQLVAPGRKLTQKVIDDLRSDPGHPQELVLHGYPPDGGNVLIGSNLAALERVLRRRPEKVRRSHQRLAQRRLVQLAGGIARAVPPYLPWIEDRLAKESSGRQLLEDVRRERLLYELSFPELAAAGDGLAHLCPTLGNEALSLVRELGALYGSKAEPEASRSVLRRLAGCPVLAVEEAATRDRFSPLHEELLTRLDGRGSLVLAERRESSSHHILGFLADADGLDPGHLGALLREHEGAVVTLLGPGAERLAWPDGSQLCLLSNANLKEILLAAEIPAAFWRAIRNRVGLKHFSPFQVGNYLEIDSPVFVGRENETRRILSGIANTSFLIVGARQIGKTSLLRHLYGEIRKEGSHSVQYVDCQGLKRRKKGTREFRVRLLRETGGATLERESDDLSAIEAALRGLRSPVLLLNEVDGLCEGSHDLLQLLRSLSEQRVCQLIMTGYHMALMSMQQPSHPFFHWVQGETGKKAFVLGPLTEPAARQLIDRLHESDLALAWESDEVKNNCYNVLLERSYRIPILLQQGCQSLVTLLDGERRQVIQKRDLEKEAASAETLVWDHLQSNRDNPKDPERTHWGDLLLAATVDQLFYLGEPPAIRDLSLREQPVERFSFTAADAKFAVQHALQQAGLSAAECAALEKRFPGSAYESFLEQMSLTVIVAPLAGGHRQYHFTEFIFPIELSRYLARSKKEMDAHLFDLVANLTYMQKQRFERARQAKRSKRVRIA